MRNAIKEIILACRFLLRSPGTLGASILILSLGLGITLYMFSAINAYVLKPLPFPGSEQLVHLELSNPAEGDDSIGVPIHDFLDWRSAQNSFEELAAFYQGTVYLSGHATPERYDGAFVTSNALTVLRVQPLIGRLFLPDEDKPGAEPVVILGYDVWRNRFSADPQIIGKTLRVNSQTAVVVGVMGPNFRFPVREEIWVPITLTTMDLKRGEGTELEVFGRLRQDKRLEDAKTEMRGISQRIAKEYPDSNQGLVAVVKPFAYEFVNEETRALLYTMFGAVIFVLLIACANVANLMLVRSIGRSREFAIRAALGAGRWRLVLQILTEAFIISVVGTAIGTLLADWAAKMTFSAIHSNPDMAPPFWVQQSTDWRTIAFAAIIALTAALLAGLMPAFRASRTNLNVALHQGGYAASQPLGRLSKILVTGQITLSCVLLICAGLMIRSVVKLGHAEIGIETSNLLTGRIGLFEAGYPDVASRTRFYESLLQKLASIPGAESATLGSSLPGTFVGPDSVLPDSFNAQDAKLPVAERVVVSNNYFEVLRYSVLAGRTFEPVENSEQRNVVVVNQLFAEKWWPGQNAVGRKIKVGSAEEDHPWLTVVGIVSNVVQDEVDEPARPAIYLPLAHDPPRFVSVAVRTRSNPMQLAGPMQKAVQELDPDLPVYWLRSLDDWLQIGRFSTTLLASLFGGFALAALLLAAAGQYAALAYSVGQRTREIGVRKALGALDSAVLRLLIVQIMRQFFLALAIGVPLAVAFSMLLSNVLFGVRPYDAFTYGIVPLTLLIVSALAAIVPAHRALRIDPARALRTE